MSEIVVASCAGAVSRLACGPACGWGLFRRLWFIEIPALDEQSKLPRIPRSHYVVKLRLVAFIESPLRVASPVVAKIPLNVVRCLYLVGSNCKIVEIDFVVGLIPR